MLQATSLAGKPGSATANSSGFDIRQIAVKAFNMAIRPVLALLRETASQNAPKAAAVRRARPLLCVKFTEFQQLVDTQVNFLRLM
jgi:hypothetical protein